MRTIIKKCPLASRIGSSLIPFLAVIILQLCATRPALSLKNERELFEKYRPLAMDESWTINGKSASTGSKIDIPINEEMNGELIQNSLPIDRHFSYRTSARPAFEIVQSSEPIEFMENRLPAPEISDEGVYGEGFYSLPKVMDKDLTRKITNPNQAPTFVSDKVVRPSMRTVTDGDGQVLATYKLLIPIFIPAVKVDRPMTTKRPDVKFYKETVTEMVPMTKIVPRVKEVIKAERVPQKLVTDYVETRGKSVPPSVTDKVLPGEKVISTTVERIW